jgi:cobalt/nickel transport system permease protein
MADALLSPSVSVVMSLASVGAIAYSVARVRNDDNAGLAYGAGPDGDNKIPVMGVMGAFVFAAQMINFTIPATGSSGHIGGGILLAAILGPYAALLTLAAVLIIQCLFFADGGLMALGCNTFNMGVFACFVAYPLIFNRIVKRTSGTKVIALASVVSVVVGLELGAFGVVAETLASGVTELPFAAFVTLMLPIHLAIGVVEGLITAAALCFVRQMRPELLEFGSAGSISGEGSLSFKKTLLALLTLAAVVGGGLSLHASAYPDGLEWSVEKIAGTAEIERSGGVYDASAGMREATAIMPDYDFKSSDGGEREDLVPGTSVAGIVGGVMTLLLACVIGAAISASKRLWSGNAKA